MTPEESARLNEVWGRVVAQSWSDPALKERLVRDPAAVLREHGVELPAGVYVQVDGPPPTDVERVVRAQSLLWLDGRLVPRERFHIDPADEGLLFGRGLWESTRTFDGVPWLWPLHLDRLRRTAELLEIDAPPQRLPDERRVAEFVRAVGVGDVVVRLNVTAGSPGRAGAVWLSADKLPAPTGPVRLMSCRTPVPEGDPYAAWKTFQYGGRLRAGKLAQRAGFDSALLLDPAGNLLEMSHANIYVRLPDGWATPPATGTALPGTVRQHLMTQAPVPVRERAVPYPALADATEAFVSNSVIGIVPVAQIDSFTFPVGDETRALAGWLLPRPAG